jgi:GT2 family glycosyltransferase
MFQAPTRKDVPAVDVVVCTRNNRDVIVETLEALDRQTLRPRNCWLIDGRSTDGTVELVESRFAWVRTLVKDSDTGPAHSRNLGLERCSSEYVLFLDSDVILAADWIQLQVAFLEADNSIAMACGKLVDVHQQNRLDAAYCAINRYGVAWNGLFGEAADGFSTPQRCISCTTAALMTRRNAMDRIGAFDAVMFAFHEDSDIGWRANVMGYSVFSNPAAVAIHKPHSTLSPKKLGSRIVYLVWRNRLRSMLINYEWSNVLRYGLPFVVLSFGEALRLAPRAPKLRGLLWNFAHFPDTLRRRKLVQRQRRVRDRDLWFLFESGIRGRVRT